MLFCLQYCAYKSFIAAEKKRISHVLAILFVFLPYVQHNIIVDSRLQIKIYIYYGICYTSNRVLAGLEIAQWAQQGSFLDL